MRHSNLRAAFAGIIACVVVVLAGHTRDACARNVLFVDLNNSHAEIDALRSSLHAGDQLIVTPSSARVSDDTRAKVLAVKRRYDDVERQARHCPTTQRILCERLWSAMQQLDREREVLVGMFAAKDLLADVRAQTNRPFDLVVISGHHSGSYFRGEFAALDANDLLMLSFSAPELLASVRTVLLLGCETGVPALIGDLFPKVFPNAYLIAGAEDSAPLRDEARNLRFIRALVESDATLRATTSIATVSRVHQSLMNKHWPVSLLWAREHYFSKTWNGRLVDMPESVAKRFKNTSYFTSANKTNNTVNAANTRESPQMLRAAAPITNLPFEPLLSPSDAIRVLRD
jgi:hypothetical protein